MATKNEAVGVPVAWVGFDEAEIPFVNQVIVQLGPPEHEGEFILTFGQMHPPLLLGDPAENRKRLESLPYVPIKVVAKLAMTEARVRELAGVIERMLKTYDEARKNRGRSPRRKR